MKEKLWITALFLMLVAGWSHAFEWDAGKFMSVDQIRPGMDAKARTVFSGSKIETFEINIVSIEERGPGKHIIWGMGKGGRIEHTGVVQGMSGSPVYIKDRLIGAIAYGATYVKDPWFGVTPIEEMLPVLDLDMTPRLARVGVTFGLRDYLGTMAALREGDLSVAESVERGGVSATPPDQLKLPLSFSGSSRDAFQYLQQVLGGGHLMPLQAQGNAQSGIDYPLEPGQPLALVYATGDQSLYGHGTVTYREGNRILAFGHPASSKGHTYFPLAGARVDRVVANQAISYRTATIGRINGTLVQDRDSGIAGLADQVPEMTPLKVRLNPHEGTPREFNYQVFMGDEALAGSIAAALVWNAVESAERGSGEYTVDVRMNFDLDGQDPIVRDFTSVGTASPAAMAGISLQAPLAALLRNEFAPVKVNGVQVDVTLRDNRHIATITEARLNKMVFRPGETIQATVTLQPYLERPVTEQIAIHIPQDTEDGPVNLLITNAASHQNWQRTRAPQRYQPRNMDQLLKILRESESGYNLITELFVLQPGMTIQGEEYPELPFSMLYVMSSPVQSGEGGFTRGTTLSVERHPMPYVIVGNRTLRISIDRNAY